MICFIRINVCFETQIKHIYYKNVIKIQINIHHYINYVKYQLDFFFFWIN